jgi:hypothetical protein
VFEEWEGWEREQSEYLFKYRKFLPNSR